TECIPVFRLLERARRDGREMIAVAMGEAGIITRILAPARGAFLTYGSIDERGATAPGQLSAADLRDLYRINSINEETKITGLVGSPTAHSVSPQMHNAAFAACGINGVYLPFEVNDVDEFMRRMVHPRSREIEWNLSGLSVTAPHKSAVMKHLDWIDPIAEKIGAVNTVAVKDGTLQGYNTDAAASLAPLEGVVDLRGANVAVIGAGGSGRAVLWRLREVHARATVFARDVARAAKTASDFDARCEQLDGARVANFFANFDVVINTTPLGTDRYSVNETPATVGELRGARIAYDLVYNPPTTRFMREAREAGCQVFGGLPMLVAQAAAQFKLWTNCDAPLDVMHTAAEGSMLDAG
ncbi:MAG TPA: shikimate dehydrogenase, partial [Pyrinomonadaceae bacterium]|nr:shikimate dehydrogenase [Pyrinomonadaceae bacterium]